MYEIRQVSTDRGSCIEAAKLLSACFPKDKRFSADYIMWQYDQNPIGKIVGFNAFAESALSAHYVTMPIRGVVSGSEELGLLSLNTATHPAHRGQKLFPKLADATYSFAAKNGFGFVIGVANAASTPGFVKKLGFQLVGQLDARIYFGSLKYNNKQTNLDFERLWCPASIAWRIKSPYLRYSKKISSNLLSYYSPSDVPFLSALMNQFKQNFELFDCLKKDFSLARLYIGINPDINWGRVLSFSIPIKLRPSPLNLIFKDLTGKDRKLSTAKFWASDFDAF